MKGLSLPHEHGALLVLAGATVGAIAVAPRPGAALGVALFVAAGFFAREPLVKRARFDGALLAVCAAALIGGAVLAGPRWAALGAGAAELAAWVALAVAAAALAVTGAPLVALAFVPRALHLAWRAVRGVRPVHPSVVGMRETAILAATAATAVVLL